MVSSKCPECGGFWDRPGKFKSESKGHPSPTLAQRIALAIGLDLYDRRGLHISSLDDDTQRDILDRWEELITKELIR